MCLRIIVADQVSYCFCRFRSNRIATSSLHIATYNFHPRSFRSSVLAEEFVRQRQSDELHLPPHVHAVCVCVCVCINFVSPIVSCRFVVSLRNTRDFRSFFRSLRMPYCIWYFIRHFEPVARRVLTMDLGSVAMTLPPIRHAAATSNTNRRKRNVEIIRKMVLDDGGPLVMQRMQNYESAALQNGDDGCRSSALSMERKR